MEVNSSYTEDGHAGQEKEADKVVLFKTFEGTTMKQRQIRLD